METCLGIYSSERKAREAAKRYHGTHIDMPARLEIFPVQVDADVVAAGALHTPIIVDTLSPHVQTPVRTPTDRRTFVTARPGSVGKARRPTPDF